MDFLTTLGGWVASPERGARCVEFGLGVSLLLSLAVLSCGADQDATADEWFGGGEASVLAQGPITVLDVGTYSIPSDCTRHMFWTDIAIRNDAHDKRVGVLWTADDWVTSKITYARYEGAIGGGYERWGVDEEGSVTCDGYGVVRHVAFAAFVETNGQTIWDPYNNYQTDGAVTLARPVQLRTSRARHANGRTYVEGDIRVLDLAYRKRVTVRFSEDGWKTHQDVEARWADSNRWTFQIDPRAALPDEVLFAVRYRVEGREYWDNNHRRNYVRRIRPVFQPGVQPYGPPCRIPREGTIEGIVHFCGRWVTDLPIVGEMVRLDETAFQPPSSESGGLVFSTLPLAQGSHRAEFQLSVENGLDIVAPIPFVVEKRVTVHEHWVPSALPEYAYASKMSSDPLGRIYLLRDRTVVRYERAGSDSFVEQCVLPSEGNIVSMSADVDGSVYVFLSDIASAALVRCPLSGGVDPSFGQNGAFDLTPFFRVYRNEVVVVDGVAYFVDMCSPPDLFATPGCESSRMVRVRLTNGEATSVEYPEDSPAEYIGADYGFDGRPGPITHDGESLWFLRNGNPVLLFQFHTNEAGEFVLAGSARVNDTRLTGGQNIVRATALARDSGGTLWAASFDGILIAFQMDARVLGAWRGGSEIPGLYFPGNGYLGGFRGPIALVPRSNQGGVLLLSEQPPITRYELSIF